MFWQRKTVIAGGPLVILFLLLTGWHYDLFHTTNWYDAVLHFLGGGFLIFSLAGTAWNLKIKLSPHVFATALLATLLAIAIVWEFAEIQLNMTPNWTQSRTDTFSDIAWSLAGAAVSLRLVSGRKIK